MTKKEIERMTSLIDERYTEEVFSTPIKSRKKFPVGWIATAAAVAIVCVGGMTLANSDGESGVATDLQTITSEAALSDYSSALVPEYSTVADPEAYFKCVPGGSIIDYAITTEWYRLYGTDEATGLAPFDASGMIGGGASLYMDKSGRPETALMYFTNYLGDDAGENDTQGIEITISFDGEMLPGFSIDGCTPVERLGAQVYGFDLSKDKDGSNLTACFTTGGIGCTVSMTDMSYGEAMDIVDSFILRCPTGENFLNAGGTEYKRVYAYESSTPFDNYLPRSKTFGDMELVSSRAGEETDTGASLALMYSNPDDTNWFSLGYYAGDKIGVAFGNDHISIEELTKDSLDLENREKDGKGQYMFGITAGDFLIWVNGNCSEDELWQAISEIKSAALFDGYLPKSDTIGGMEKQYGTENSSDKIIVMYKPADQSDDSFISLTYTTDTNMESFSSKDKWVTLDELTEESLARFAVVQEQEGRYIYALTIDMGSFIIDGGGRCTPEEMWQVISEIKGNSISIEGTPFDGHLPKSDTIGGMRLTRDSGELVTAETQQGGVSKTLKLHYVSENDTDIGLTYIAGIDIETYNARMGSDCRADLNTLTRGGLADYYDPEIDRYVLTLQIDDFIVGVSARCTADELWQVICEINGDSTDSTPKGNSVSIEGTPFDKYLPESDRIGGMELVDDMELVTGSTEQGGTSSQMHVYYKDPVSGSYINIMYLTGIDMEKYSAELDDYRGADLDSLTRNSLADYIREDGSYMITFPADDILIAIGAQCTPDELWQVICEIKGDSADSTVFDGHMPKSDRIGDMERIDKSTELYSYTDYTDGQVSGGTVYVYYEGAGDFIALWYTTDVDSGESRPAVNIAELTKENLDSFEVSEGRYEMDIQFTDFHVTIDAQCTPDELWQLISEIL